MSRDLKARPSLSNRLLEGRHLLLVEDEPLIALDVEELCLEHGAAQVATIRRAEEAQSLDFSLFDAAIVDLVLGDHSSLPLAARMRAHNLPIVFTSGYTHTPELALDFPEVAMLSKPYAGSTLVEALVAAIKPGSRDG
jgi:DNA-binding response OmpR family regulator